MRVAAFQLDVRRGDVAANLARVEAALEEAASAEIALVVLPEMWPTSFDDASPERTAAAEDAVRRVARRGGELGLVVAGSAYAPGPEGAPPFNRLHVLEGGREVLGYDKVHLFSPTAETEGFSAGERPPETVETGAARLSGVVCYDLRFGPLVRRPFLDGAELLVCPAQWPRPRAAHWEALLRGRAVENQCVVVGCNRTGTEVVGRRGLELDFPGNSYVVGPDGRVLARGRGEEGLVAAEVDLEEVRRLRRRVPVRKDAREELYRRWG